MPIRTLAGFAFRYALVVFDADGHERPEADGTLLSETLFKRIGDTADPVTDVFFASHGWQGDVPAAIEQYDRWLGSMAGQQADLAAAAARPGGFTPLIVGLHWPSLPWGDEEAPTGGGGVLSAASSAKDATPDSVDVWAHRIADTPRARAAIQTILERAAHESSTAASATLRDAYATLFDESGLATKGAGAAPGADQDAFEPAAIIEQSRQTENAAGAPAAGGPQLLGIGESIRELLLSPLRQLSFWKMKDRARAFGESGGHALLARLQSSAPNARFHLMGHSFGCIVVSATVAGKVDGPALPRPVDSLFLVQGALSLWSYAADIPYAPGTAGYFHRIVGDGLVRGPIVTTRSSHDTAVGRFYPLGAQVKGQLVLGEEFPKYGGIGSFGIQGLKGLDDEPMGAPTCGYGFRGGKVYNLEASAIICHGGGASGAHSDIAHPEVAHAFWGAILSGTPTPPGTRAMPRASSPGAPMAAGASAASSVPDASASRSALPAASESRAPGAPLTRGAPASVAAPARSAPAARSAPPGGLLGGTAPAAVAATPPPDLQRYVNVELEDHATGEPLATGQWYTLAVDIDMVRHSASIAAAPLAEDGLFVPGIDEVVLTVQLDSADFEIADPVRPLRLARSGRSSNKARFDLSPRHDGASTITATLHKDGNFLQHLEITFDVGNARAAAVETTARGRPPGAASVLKPRDIGISLTPTSGGYDCAVWGAVAARARLPLQPGFLGNAIDVLRRELMKVVMHQDATGRYGFQAGIDIADADRDFALTTMARAGSALFQKLFFGPGAAADSKAVGDFLRRSASDPAGPLKLQIVAESAPIPWSLLYIGDASAGAKLDWAQFIGMRHIVEQIPLQNTLAVSDSVIASEPRLAVSVNLNSGIDAQLGGSYVAEQQQYWVDAQAAHRRIGVVSRTTRADVIGALANAATADQILYFYCHAEAAGLDDPGGPDASALVLTDARITLGDLNLDAPTTTQLAGKPLVFINACESAELSPTFYDGFVPYFMAKGARGVVGTQCKTPALFAAEWAHRFFERFLDGGALGEVFLALRREFLEKHGNPLGLLYAVHCDGDAQIEPALG